MTYRSKGKFNALFIALMLSRFNNFKFHWDTISSSNFTISFLKNQNALSNFQAAILDRNEETKFEIVFFWGEIVKDLPCIWQSIILILIRRKNRRRIALCLSDIFLILNSTRFRLQIISIFFAFIFFCTCNTASFSRSVMMDLAWFSTFPSRIAALQVRLNSSNFSHIYSCYFYFCLNSSDFLYYFSRIPFIFYLKI